MKELEKYGTALAKYEGVADLTFPEVPGNVYKGYFEVSQSITGGIAVGFVPVTYDTSDLNINRDFCFYKPRIDGRDLDNWQITTCGQTSQIPFIGSFASLKNAAPPTFVFGSQGLKATRSRDTDTGYKKAHFQLANLFWHIGSMLPKPITFALKHFVVTISPVIDYLMVADSVKAGRGIAPTADVFIETSDQEKQPLKAHADLMNSLTYVFRLITGNRIDWFFGEGLDDLTGRAVERFHKDAITGPFSKAMRSHIFEVDLERLADAIVDTEGLVGDKDTIKKLIDYFVNCCDETSYLEARGLLASTLADLIVTSYAETQKLQNLMKDDEFKTLVLPSLEVAVKRVKLPELSNEIRRRTLQQLRGAYRRSFDQRLDLLIDKFKLPLNREDRRRVVNIRNKLVHEGTYPSKNSDDWYGDYRFILWVDFIALCRLGGYDGNLPLQAPYQR